LNLLVALLAGSLFAISIYLMLRRSVVKLIIGLCILSHATNLIILAAGGMTRAAPPIVRPGDALPPTPHSDPLPQALILTAIVIGFGVLAFMMALVSRAIHQSGIDDSDAFTASDPQHDQAHDQDQSQPPSREASAGGAA
jgi:multicomponent Na+:H+ antiporter subunit C